MGEIYRYQLTGAGYGLNELKATQDWFVVRELKQVPGIIDVSTFGGTTRQYQADINPNKLLQYNVTLPQVITALAASNQNVGGNHLEIGDQNVNVRGVGLLKDMTEMGAVLIAEHNGVPVYLRDVAEVKEGYQPPLGRVGRDRQDNIVRGTVLLQRGEQSLPALKGVRAKIAALNSGMLPKGVRIDTIYDRTALIDRECPQFCVNAVPLVSASVVGASLFLPVTLMPRIIGIIWLAGAAVKAERSEFIGEP